MVSANTIEVRRLKFNIPKDLPTYWNANCPIKTHLFNAIAILAPTFERLAISSLIPYRHHVQGRLSEQVQAFIGQESAHNSEFVRVNQVLKAQGYGIKHLARKNIRYFKWFADKFSPLMHLSLTLAAEHLTAIISDLILRDKYWLEQAYPSMAALWRWHAIEEIEHKAVAFDVYQQMGGSYLKRILGMGVVSTVLGGLLARNFLILLWQDKLLWKIATWHKFFKMFFFKRGICWQLWLPYWRYFSPRFHPWQQDNHGLIAKWKEIFNQVASPLEMTQWLRKEELP